MSTVSPASDRLGEELDTLRRQVEGPVLTPGQDGFDAEITGFNLATRHRAAVVVGAAGVQDVAAAVRFATRHSLPVAVQATGHGAVQAADGALLITTSRMRGVTVDPSDRSARIDAGCTWMDVIAKATPHGLAPLCGSSSRVGVVGYTLGGGIGPISRTFGFAADHVREITVVTADGQVRVTAPHQEPDLFWGLRGGKGSLGVVTSIVVDLFPVTSLYGGGLYYAAEDTPAVLRAYADWAGTLPEATTTSVALLRLPPLPDLPPQLRGRFVTHLRFAHLGEAREAEALLAPMRAVAEPVLDGIGQLPFSAIDSVHSDPVDPMPTWERGSLLREFTEETAQALLAVAGPQSEVPLAIVELRQLGGALAREPREPNAVGGRDAAYSVLVIGAPVPELMDTVIPAVGRAVIDALSPWSTGGTLLNFHGSALAPDELARAWPEPVLTRLAALKERYDPARVFRFGHVVPRR
ncbi:FAD/FMN-containing dehydrogenase [Streptosporangium becharense]|uniref:FAD/FMN-containing dehydrogenase n=1 Tax=Streptosporangium becharense TaxID=1816182 RepID=A0A7W9IG59_9ACTN|nr:FAD-binding oxidoreductase [Streptosporangium becharense]MBB2909077.1 FAD/FMN-containing dehydrogenase [Streptosporangium becharense]MBB5819905.1 FAD/FMN-containing dehydrogenase [Streptosporangium becharense]